MLSGPLNQQSDPLAFTISASLKIQGGEATMGGTTQMSQPAPLVSLNATTGDANTHIVVTCAVPMGGSAAFGAFNGVHVTVVNDQSFKPETIELEKDIPVGTPYDLGTFTIGTHFISAYFNA
jgi:hypothetical protein